MSVRLFEEAVDHAKAGGTGDLLSLSLNVPPWQDLHELSREELRLTNLVTTDMVAQPGDPAAAVVELGSTPGRNRSISSAVATETNSAPTKSTKAVEAMVGWAVRALPSLDKSSG